VRAPLHIVLAVCVAFGAVRATGDEVSPALAKFQQPVDQAIDRALAYLAEQQERDGSFPSRGMRHNTGIASLCVMAFLAKGYSPGAEPYGDVIDKGVDFVVGTSQNNGMLVGQQHSHGAMYSHTISTLMLSEVTGMVDPERQRRVDAALGKALRLLLAAQKVSKSDKHRGGWRYQHNSRDSDISCSGWALMSLRSARNNGAAVPKDSIEKAVEFVMNCRQKRDGGFSYQPGGGSGLARTGTALLCLELCGFHRDTTTVGAGDYILRNMKHGGQHGFYYYGMYYAAQGMFQLGEDHWEKFGAYMYETLLKDQHNDGSWPGKGGNENSAGPCYSTSMAVLAMSVAYRQLPIYQR